MLPIKVKQKTVSYIETKPVLIRVPSFHISIESLKLGGVFLLLILICFITLSSSSSVKVIEPTRSTDIVSSMGIVVAERSYPLLSKIGDIKQASVMPDPLVKRNKVIPITDIITDKKVLEFLCKNEIIKRAKAVQDQTGLSVATILGQKGVESNWGKSSLTIRTKNYGNIKCKCNWDRSLRKKHDKTGYCIQAWDKKERSNHYYVALKTNYQGWNLYKDLIYKRYMKAAKQDNIYDQIVWLKKQRYATDKNYVKVIWAVINKYKLLELQQYIDEGYTITTINGKYKLIEQ